MPRIRHIALTTKEPAKVAAFYKDAFGMQEIRRAPNGAVFLTDGYLNLAILNWKTEKSADVGANGPNYSGIHHFGFEVEDLDEAAAKLERAEGQRLEEKEGLGVEMAAGGHRNFEMKWTGPDDVVIDGRCTTLTGLSEFVSNLEASGYFKRSIWPTRPYVFQPVKA